MIHRVIHSDVLRAWPLWLAALWWGSLTALGAWVVPTLFAQLSSRVLAGSVAAALFGVQAKATLVLGAGLLFASNARGAVSVPSAAAPARGFVLAGMILALLLEFAVAPRILARIDLPLWHALGSVMLLGQWLCAGVVFWRVAGARNDAADVTGD